MAAILKKQDGGQNVDVPTCFHQNSCKAISQHFVCQNSQFYPEVHTQLPKSPHYYLSGAGAMSAEYLRNWTNIYCANIMQIPIDRPNKHEPLNQW